MRKQFLFTFSEILFLFFLSSILPLFPYKSLLSDYAFFYAYSLSITPYSNFTLNFILAIVFIFFGIFFFHYILKKRLKFLVKIVEFFVILAFSSIFFYSLFRLIKVAVIESLFFAIISSFLLWFFNRINFNLKNATALFISAGASAFLAFSFPITALFFLLLILSLYDYFAVMVSKHMLFVAEESKKNNLPVVISSTVRKVEKKEVFFEIGSGDTILSSSLALSFLSYCPNFFILSLLLSLIAILTLFFLSLNKRMMLPAVPIITLFNFPLVAFVFWDKGLII